ncbi:hypothetical protein LTR08_008532 [Meristemomyces frigidus]|nr:hypothetical protein LTR08_008532 [Meristemomyces frigidus]
MATQAPVPISSSPAAGQLVSHEGKTYDTIREGRAYILTPPNTRTSVNPAARKVKAGDAAETAQNVFYNPIQQFNRDLSVLAIKAFGEDLCEKRSLRAGSGKQQAKQQAKKERKQKRKAGQVTGADEEGDRSVDGKRDAQQAEGRDEEEMVGKPSQEGVDAAESVAGPANGGEEQPARGGAPKQAAAVVDSAEGVEAVPHLEYAAPGELTLAESRGTKRKATASSNGHDNANERAVKMLKVGHGAAAPASEQLASNGKLEPQAAEGAMKDGILDDEAPSPLEDATTGHTDVAGPANEAGNAEQGQDLDTKGTATQQSFKPKFRILDALSATGLRALRYGHEIPFVTSITANDMDRNATKSIRTNAQHNKLEHLISVNTGNAMGVMYSAAFPAASSHGPTHVSGKYDVIDLDPYGTAAPFIDSALQALNDGGLLCVTCTDSGVFASCGYSEKTFSLYGGMPIKGPHSHEGGLRLIINSVASTAAKYGLAIEPLLSLSIDFYVRIFIRVSKSPADVKFLAGKTMLVYGCDNGCGAWYPQMIGRDTRQTGKKESTVFNFKHSIAQGPSVDRLCEHCKSKMHVAGPMWAGPLHNAAFVEKVLTDARAADIEVYQTKPRIEGMLDTALEELVVIDGADKAWRDTLRKDGTREMIPKTPPETVDQHPFFFIPSALSKVIHCIAPPEAAVKGALRHAGYRATRSHCKPGSIKTDAPWTVIWEVMREWVRQKQPIKEGALKPGLAGWHIMQAARKPEEEQNGAENGEADMEKEVTEGIAEAAPASPPPSDDKRINVVFDEALGKDKTGKRLVRYQQNPRENWGPMARAKGNA